MHLTASLSVLLLGTAAMAQSWSFSLDPRASYLRTNNEVPAAPLVLNLASMGLTSGDWLRIETVGAYRSIAGGPDTYRSLVGVFASSASLLASTAPHRVVGAIAAGPTVLSGPTFVGALPIDIPEDFDCSRNGWDTGIDVPIPLGATHLFLGTHESWCTDNVDLNGDFGVVVTKLPTPTLPGTGEHVALRGAVNGVPASWPDVHAAPAGSTLSVEMQYPLGLLDGSTYAFVGEVVPTGTPAPNPLPGLWSASLIMLKVGTLPPTPGFTDSLSLVVPPGLLGTSVILQAGALSPLARNWEFETTSAHRFELQ